MGFLAFLSRRFESRKTKEKKAAVMNVIAVMVADGTVDSSEKALLNKVCRRVGLSEKKLKKMLSNPGKVQFIVPRSPDERVYQLIDMVFMMMADGKIDERELRVTKTFAGRLGFSPSMVAKLVKGIIDGSQKGHSRVQVNADVAEWAQT